jgi:hypothetical protein
VGRLLAPQSKLNKRYTHRSDTYPLPRLRELRGLATEEMLSRSLPLGSAEGYPINASILLPGLLRDSGDLPDVLARIETRRVLMAAGVGQGMPGIPSTQVMEERFARDSRAPTDRSRGRAPAYIRGPSRDRDRGRAPPAGTLIRVPRRVHFSGAFRRASPGG